MLFIIVALGASFGGWWYGSFQAEQKSNQQISDLKNELNALNKKISVLEADTKKQRSPESDYLIIKGWGVKLKSTKASMSYVIETYDGNQAVILTNTDVQKLGGNCDKDTGLATISRYTDKMTETEASQGIYIDKIGGYYYYVVGSNGTCSDNEAELAVRSELIAAAKTLVAQ